MQGRKRILKNSVLLFTILIPVIIYLFLKGFGDNRFTVPVYYASGVNSDTTDCQFSDSPHRIDWDNYLPYDYQEKEFPVLKDKLTVIDLAIPGTDISSTAFGPLQRVSEIFRDRDLFQVITLVAGGQTQATPVENPSRIKNPAWKTIKLDTPVLSSFAKCGLILLDYSPTASAWNKRLVLVDDRQRIRGYYDAYDFDEIERLILESRIILDEEY